MERTEILTDDLPALIKAKIDNKTKPLGALGMLEELAERVCLIQDTLTPSLNKPSLLVFAGDHGIVEEGVSLYPQEVTYQMVYNFLGGGAAINVFCRQYGISLNVVDAGVNYDFPPDLPLAHLKIDKGTANFLKAPAMKEEQCEKALNEGERLVKERSDAGCNVIGFGEMGIGNTTSAAAIMSVITGMDPKDCTGAGTGLGTAQMVHKTEIIRKAIALHKLNTDEPLRVLQTFGGFEIAMMCGAMLAAHRRQMILLIDGFIATAALLVASRLSPRVLFNSIFCHQSEEKGHKKMLEFLEAKPILNLGMRLGEGTGAAIAYPVIQSAVAFVNEMASFESAGVSK